MHEDVASHTVLDSQFPAISIYQHATFSLRTHRGTSLLSLSLFASCAIAGMDDGHHSRSRSDNLELHPSPTFRELFEQDQAASRLLEPNSTFDGNKRSSTHHVNDTSFDLADKVTPVGNKSPHYRYESVDTTDKSASENAAHVL